MGYDHTTLVSGLGAEEATFMSGFVALLYTVVGGVLGAGLNQYVTHLRDRRTARALVIERLHEAEATLAELRWAEGNVKTINDLEKCSTSLEKLLAALESACLIAGIPRAAVVVYTGCCRLYGGYKIADLQIIEAIEAAEGVISSPNVFRQ